MKDKKYSITIRLTEDDYNTITNNSKNQRMTVSDYIRAMVHNALPNGVDYRQDIAPIICRIYIQLQKLGINEEDITKEVHTLCQMLS